MKSASLVLLSIALTACAGEATTSQAPACPKNTELFAAPPAAPAPPVSPPSDADIRPSPEVMGSSAPPQGAGAPPESSPPKRVVTPINPNDMVRPRRLSGRMPVYSREARKSCVEGTLIARCILTTNGTFRSCRVVRSLPPFDGPVLESLSTWRMTPVLFKGKPIEIEYTIPFKIKLH